MAIPVTTALGRRDRLWPAALASAAVHAALIVWALLHVPAPAIDLEQKPIVAKLVRLGEKRPEQYLPRREVAPPPPAPVRGTGNTLASVMSKVQKQVKEEQWGSPDGDPAGDSETAEEGDRYLAVVKRAIESNYQVFSTTVSDRERMYLKTAVVLYIDPDGRLSRWHIETPSGNGGFDAAVERALRSTRVPPPPDGQKDLYRRGIAIVFTP